MYFVFDIGGTYTRCAVSRNGEILDEERKFKTSPLYGEEIILLRQCAKEMSKGVSGFSGVAGGVAGVRDPDTKIFFHSRRPDWGGRDLAKDIAGAFGAPCVLENDAALAGLAESVFGAGKGFSIVAYLTVSTGVGGARIVDKKIDRNTFGFEPGHQVIHERKTLEDWVSGRAFHERFGKPAEEAGEDEWQEAATLFSYGLINTIVHWSSDAVVLGGPLVLKNTHMFFERACEKVKEALHIFPRLPVFKKAELEDRAGLLGALYALHHNYFHL